MSRSNAPTYLHDLHVHTPAESVRHAMRLQAWVRLIDAHYALGQYAQAAEVCREAVQRDSSFRFRDEFKVGGPGGRRCTVWHAQ